MSARATLNGIPLDASGPITWALTIGAEPYRTSWRIAAAAAAQIMDADPGRGRSVLRWEVPGHPALEVGGITILGTSPTAEPWTVTLELTDWRDDLRYEVEYLPANLRRRTGELRRANEGAPDELAQINQDQAFAPFSLNGSEPWEPLALLQEFFRRRNRTPEVRSTPPWTLPVQNTLVKGQANEELGRLLGLWGGGLQCYVDLQGEPVLFDALNGGERLIVGVAGAGGLQASRIRGAAQGGPPSVVGPQLWGETDLRKYRPEAVVSCFDRLVELRFDYDETAPPVDTSGTSSTTNSDPEAIDQPLYMENVVQIPDLELTIPARGDRPERKVYRGAWVTVQEALDAWNADGWAITSGPLATLTVALLRQTFLAGLEAWADPTATDAAIYGRRVASLRTHYRQTYRISPFWRARVGRLIARRSELNDAELGTFAPAEVFQDYAEYLTARGAIKEVEAKREGLALLRNVYGAGQVGLNLLEQNVGPGGMNPAPAEVRILDDDQGIVRVEFPADPNSFVRYRIPSALETRSDGTAASTAKANEAQLFADSATLRESHRVSIVLSAEVAAPNDARAFHTVEVPAGDVDLPNMGPAEAPKRYVLQPAADGRGAARFPWRDDVAEDFRLAFLRDGAAGLIDSLGDPCNKDELDDVARAQATQTYVRHLDRIEGELTTGLAPGIEPDGSVVAVTHTLAPTGEATTTVTMAGPILTPPHLDAFLPDSTRRKLNAEVIP